eukprot:Pgem_evm1s19741
MKIFLATIVLTYLVSLSHAIPAVRAVDSSSTLNVNRRYISEVDTAIETVAGVKAQAKVEAPENTSTNTVNGEEYHAQGCGPCGGRCYCLFNHVCICPPNNVQSISDAEPVTVIPDVEQAVTEPNAEVKAQVESKFLITAIVNGEEYHAQGCGPCGGRCFCAFNSICMCPPNNVQSISDVEPVPEPIAEVNTILHDIPDVERTEPTAQENAQVISKSIGITNNSTSTTNGEEYHTQGCGVCAPSCYCACNAIC